MSTISFSAKLSIFGKDVTLTPNIEFPHRIESSQAITLKFTDPNPQDSSGKTTIGDAVTNYLKVPSNDFNLDQTKLDYLEITDLIIDTESEEFQLGVKVGLEDTFFLNKYPDIFDISWVSVFITTLSDATN